MKSKFEGWYPKDSEQIAAIWKTAIFVPDANILLHCVRHPQHVRDELLRLFAALGQSLWIPYQVGLEFHRNRLDVEKAAWDAYEQVERDCEKAINQARDRLRQLRAHPTINIEKELAALDTFIADFKGRLTTAKEEHPTDDISNVVDQLSELFNGRVGEKWSAAKLSDIKKEGEARYARKQPPGFLDSKKDGDEYRKFGDLIIWKDMMEKATTEKRPIIFISDDVKEDWWWIHRGQKKGARPELSEEFRAVSAQEFHMYEFSNFIRVAAKHHPEFKDGVEAIEKSLQHDSDARVRLSYSEAGRELKLRITVLEDERDATISRLSGTPSTETDRGHSLDRKLLRERLLEINSELAGLEKAQEGDDEGD